VLARGLGAASMGIYAYATWLVGAAVLLLELEYPLAHWIARLYAEDKLLPAATLAQRAVVLQLAIALIAVLALLFLRQPLERTLPWPVAAVIVPLVAVQLFTCAASGILAGRHKFRDLFTVTFLTAIVQFGLICWGYAFRWGIKGMLAASLVASTAGAVLAYRSANRALPFLKITKIKLAPETWSGFRSVAIVAMIGGLTDMVVWQRSEVWFLERYCSASEVAFYTIAFLVVGKLAAIPLAATSHLTPSWSEAWARGQQELIASAVNHSIRYSQCVVAGLAVFGFVAAPQAVHLVYGEAFAVVVPLVRILLVTLPLTAIAGIPASLLTSAGRARTLVYIGIPAALINVLLDFALIPRFGARGAAVANGIVQVTTVLVAFAVTRCSLQYRLPWKAIAYTYSAGIAAVLPILCLPGNSGPVLLAAGWCTGLAAYPLLLLATRVLVREDFYRLRNAVWPVGASA
jgi:O-antigen/teichoic acid export membrane protein